MYLIKQAKRFQHAYEKIQPLKNTVLNNLVLGVSPILQYNVPRVVSVAVFFFPDKVEGNNSGYASA